MIDNRQIAESPYYFDTFEDKDDDVTPLGKSLFCIKKRFAEDGSDGVRSKKCRKSKRSLPYVPVYITNACKDKRLPAVRMPSVLSVPLHLKKEFTILFPPTISDSQKSKKDIYMLKPSEKIIGLEKDIMLDMEKFYTPEKLNVIVGMHKRMVDITFSTMDHFCINYAVDKDFTYKLHPDDVDEFSVNKSYNARLSQFGRLYFDPYCRNKRILIEYVDNNSPLTLPKTTTNQIEWDNKMSIGVRVIDQVKYNYLITSIGQLVFYEWAITNKVYAQCMLHATEIRKHELEKNTYKKTSDADSPDKVKYKRRSLVPKKSSAPWMSKKVDLVFGFSDDLYVPNP